MIPPIKCFGKDDISSTIMPEEFSVRNGKFVFPPNLYSILIKKPNYSFYAKSPDLLVIKAGTQSLKFIRRFNITDEYEGFETITEYQFPINNDSLITLKFPYGFRFTYLSQGTSIQVSNKNFTFSKIEQPRENYKYYIHFNIGERINFITQAQYSTKNMISVLYNVDQLTLIHSIHPFTHNFLISSCFKFRKIGPSDFYQKINYFSEKYNCLFGFFDIIRDLKKLSLNKSQFGLHIIKKFKHLTAGVELQTNKREFPRIFPAFHTKFNIKKFSTSFTTDLKKTICSLRYHFTESSNFTISLSKHIDTKKIGLFVKYIDEN